MWCSFFVLLFFFKSFWHNSNVTKCLWLVSLPGLCFIVNLSECDDMASLFSHWWQRSCRARSWTWRRLPSQRSDRSRSFRPFWRLSTVCWGLTAGPLSGAWTVSCNAESRCLPKVMPWVAPQRRWRSLKEAEWSDWKQQSERYLFAFFLTICQFQ